MVDLKTVAHEVVDPSWVYQTAINDIRVTVRRITYLDLHEHPTYHVTVEKNGTPVDTMCEDDQTQALMMADLLRDIYYNDLDQAMLHH